MKIQAQWRTEKRQARQALTIQEKQHYSQQIAQKVIETEVFKQAEHIACYLSLVEEVDTSGIIQAAWQANKIVYLPVVIGWKKPLLFAPFYPDCLMTKDYLNIDIPLLAEADYSSANLLDLVISPLVAFDWHRNRIGMGGGFYDRTFAFKSCQSENTPQLFGVAFERQKTSVDIETQIWDIALDRIFTEQNIY